MSTVSPTDEHVSTLEPLHPEEARDMYLESRADELAERSIELHERHTESFVDYLADEGIENMNDVTARTIHGYKLSVKIGWAQSIDLAECK